MVDQNSQFYAILTNVGAAKQANADALGIAWKITHMGVGDANGTDPTPNANQASLINEWRRAPLNQLKVDDKNNAIIVAEQVIPADVGGRWIREIALYDADGDMVAVANCAPTYKPLLSQGSGRTQVVRMNLIVSSSSNVELKIDPSVVLATREWVTEELAKQDFKHSVQAATTTNIALSGLQSVDGVSLGAGARVLVKNQTAGKDNGLYTVAAGTWKRCPDADTNAKVTPGLLVLVERGAVNGDSAWQMVTDAPVTLGVTALAFEMAFGRTGVAAGTYRSVTVDTHGRVLAATNPTTVAGYGLTDVYTKTQIDQALALKAPLANPALTGVPTAPTAPIGTNTAQLANTAFVQAAIAALVASSPGALDTLNELAAALGNDPNFATTMTNALALKAPLASPVFTGDPKAPTMAASDNDTSIATTAFVRAALALFGLGAPSANVVNIDDVSLNGFYVVGENTLGTKPKHPITGETLPSGQIMHIHRPSTVAATQLWDTLTSGEPLTFIRSRLGNSSQWTPWAQIWTSANSPKMDSLTDPTVGRVVTVGGHGVGRGILSEEVDLNRYTTPGNYVTAQYPINIPMDWLSSGRRYALSVEGLNSSGHLIQRLTSGLSGEGVRVAIRSFSASQQWSAWDELPVSQDRPFKGVQAYRAVGVSTWTVPAGVKKVWVTVIGGGGGGGFAPAANSVGSAGGGGGGLSQRLVSLGGVTSVAVTVGAGGTGATVAGDAGGTGGSSSFGTYLSATGGAGGGGNNPNGNAPGTGGRGAGGDYNTSLGAGAPNYGLFGGTGGGPGPRSTQASTSGGSAADAGGGGSGAYSGNAGGNGAPGCVIIHW